MFTVIFLPYASFTVITAFTSVCLSLLSSSATALWADPTQVDVSNSDHMSSIPTQIENESNNEQTISRSSRAPRAALMCAEMASSLHLDDLPEGKSN
jgi:hypothetical protein